ncbi:hypothetical protein F4860DRAFT_502297 [Xylaria cubensis]|nr:hypothetical protein F4860DRAFT_502297 [Xylaria cubensis]
MATPGEVCPFSEEDSFFDKLTDKKLPPNADGLVAELNCELLEALYPHLDLIARKSSSHIDPLHAHLRKQRTIQITEDGHLHLLWDASTVLIKPLPAYLLNSDFWRFNLAPGSACRLHAFGFIRTYAYLIRHPSDFIIAQKENLIPPTTNELCHSEFEAFIQNFRVNSDERVSPRWHFGQIRLTWLNWAVRIFQPMTTTSSRGMFGRFFYTEQYYQTGQFLREFGPPILFMFATLSLILSAMQVVLAARADDPWTKFALVSAWFSVATIIALISVFLVLALVAAFVFALQLNFALRARGKQATLF